LLQPLTRFDAEQRLAGAFKIGKMRLALRCYSMHVAKAPLERTAVEDRVGAGGVIGEVDDTARRFCCATMR